MISLLKTVYRFSSKHSRRLLLRTLRIAFALCKARVIIVYDSKNVFDGFGAQLHRILSLIHVAHQFKFEILKPQVNHITLHPLDPMRSLESMSEFLVKCEKIFFQSKLYFNDESILEKSRIENVSSLNLRFLFRIFFRRACFRTTQVLVVQDAHSLADLEVDTYSDTIKLYFRDFLQNNILSSKNEELIVHYRQGSGEFAIYPGQSISRQIPLSYFGRIISSVLYSKNNHIKTIRVFTDSPKTDVSYFPPKEQLSFWANSPGFDGDKVIYKGLDVEAYFASISKAYEVEVIVERNVDPAEMIISMANSTVLITSRSSLSYVGGLFNERGIIFYAPQFWHMKPRRWILDKGE
jgi:hypothetical protein